MRAQVAPMRLYATAQTRLSVAKQTEDAAKDRNVPIFETFLPSEGRLRVRHTPQIGVINGLSRAISNANRRIANIHRMIVVRYLQSINARVLDEEVLDCALINKRLRFLMNDVTSGISPDMAAFTDERYIPG